MARNFKTYFWAVAILGSFALGYYFFKSQNLEIKNNNKDLQSSEIEEIENPKKKEKSQSVGGNTVDKEEQKLVVASSLLEGSNFEEMPISSRRFRHFKQRDRAPAQLTSQIEGENQKLIEEKSGERYEYSNFKISAAFLQSRLDSKDRQTGGKAILGSNFVPNLGIRWNQNWQNAFQSFVVAEARRENFSSDVTTHTIEGQAPVLWGFGLGARLHQMVDRFFLESSVHFDSEPFLIAKSVGLLKIQETLVPKLRILGDLVLLKSTIFKISTEFFGAYLFPYTTSSYVTKSGYQMGGGLYIHHAQATIPFLAGLVVDYRNQDTNISKQSNLSVGLKLGIEFDVGVKEKTL